VSVVETAANIVVGLDPALQLFDFLNYLPGAIGLGPEGGISLTGFQVG